MAIPFGQRLSHFRNLQPYRRPSTSPQIEQVRCLLAENDQFIVNDGFNTIDQWGRGYLTSQDLLQFCS